MPSRCPSASVKVVFVIKRENEKEFREAVGNRAAKFLQVEYAFQELTDIPQALLLPPDL